MRILFLSPRQCWPALTGAKLREYYLLRALAEHAEVAHVSFRDSSSDMRASRSLALAALLGVRERSLPAPRRYTPLKILRGAFGPWPLSVVNYTSRDMKAAIAELVARERFDLVHIDSIHMAAYAPLLPAGLPVIYDWHNIESELMRRYSEQAPSRAHAAYARLAARRLEALERRILREAFGHIVCSEREREQLLAAESRARVTVAENGVDCGARTGLAGEVGLRRRIVFVGSMGYHANVAAAVWFARNVWPRVRARFPEWRLTLVGSNPAPAVRALAEEPGIQVTGTVPDVRPYYADAVAAVVPLLTGGGTRLKILEAMAAGVPVISTPVGAEGLAVKPGENCLLAAVPEEWLSRLEALAGGGRLWNTLSRAGRELVRSRYDWETIGRGLYDTYCGWLERGRSGVQPAA